MKLRNNYYLRNKDTGYVISFTTRKEQMIFYNELNGWEVVDIVNKSNEGATAEPLIKDEKIRKAVKAWAEANEETEIKVKGGCLVATFKGLHKQLELELNCTWTRDGVYSIAELCGEEE